MSGFGGAAVQKSRGSVVDGYTVYSGLITLQALTESSSLRCGPRILYVSWHKENGLFVVEIPWSPGL